LQKSLKEKSIILDEVSPVDLWGSNNHNQKLLQERFPRLKLVSRGNVVKVKGEEKDVEAFEKELDLLLHFVKNKGRLSEQKFHELLESAVFTTNTAFLEEEEESENKEKESDSPIFKDDPVIVHGPNGKTVRARTDNQRKLVEYVAKNDIVFALGPAGTGKTYTAVALAVKALKNKEIKRIILARPAVEAGENRGFLPGDLQAKTDPDLRPLYDALDDVIQADELKALSES